MLIWIIGFLFTVGCIIESPHTDGEEGRLCWVSIFVWPMILGGILLEMVIRKGELE